MGLITLPSLLDDFTWAMTLSAWQRWQSTVVLPMRVLWANTGRPFSSDRSAAS